MATICQGLFLARPYLHKMLITSSAPHPQRLSYTIVPWGGRLRYQLQLTHSASSWFLFQDYLGLNPNIYIYFFLAKRKLQCYMLFSDKTMNKPTNTVSSFCHLLKKKNGTLLGSGRWGAEISSSRSFSLRKELASYLSCTDLLRSQF